MAEDWNKHLEREEARFRDGSERLPDDPDGRQRQLTRMGNAAYGSALSRLMLGEPEEAASWFARAAETYEQSYADAPPGSWGRLVAMIKCGLLAGDRPRAEEYARRTLDEGAADSDSPIGRYAATLALLTLDRPGDAHPLASSLRERQDFPADVADTLAMIAAEDAPGYILAVESVLDSFEQRDEYLEDIPVADTVLVLQTLARTRGLSADLASDLLPPG
jgi:predicted Zn-dependent protease